MKHSFTSFVTYILPVCDLHSPRLWLTNGSFEAFKLLEKMRSDKTSCSKHINTYLNLLKHLSTKGFQHGKSFPTLTKHLPNTYLSTTNT